jgi:hypothetical protein
MWCSTGLFLSCLSTIWTKGPALIENKGWIFWEQGCSLKLTVWLTVDRCALVVLAIDRCTLTIDSCHFDSWQMCLGCYDFWQMCLDSWQMSVGCYDILTDVPWQLADVCWLFWHLTDVPWLSLVTGDTWQMCLDIGRCALKHVPWNRAVYPDVECSKTFFSWI